MKKLLALVLALLITMSFVGCNTPPNDYHDEKDLITSESKSTTSNTTPGDPITNETPESSENDDKTDQDEQEETLLVESVIADEVKNRTRSTTPMVTFFDDDGCAAVWNKLKPLSDTYNIPFVLAVVSNRIEDTSGTYLNLSQLLELQTMGWEMSSHTMNHVQLGTLSYEEQEAEIGGSKAAFDAYGLDVTTICYPFSSTNDNTNEIVKKYFKAGRQTNWKEWTNTSPLETWDMRVTPLGSYFETQSESGLDTNSLEYYKYMVDQAVKSNAWLMFMTHCNEHDETQQTYLEETIKYIQSLDIPIVTFSEGLEKRGNIIDVGRYNRRDLYSENAEYYVVGCDGKSAKSSHDTYMIKLPNNSVTNDTPITAFAPYAISTCRITGTDGGFPSQTITGGGTLVTNTLGYNHANVGHGRAYQEYILPNSAGVLRRTAISKTEWSEWSYGDCIRLLQDSVSLDDSISKFPTGVVSRVHITKDGTNSKMPDGEGFLYTDKTFSLESTPFGIQVYIPIVYWKYSGAIYYRLYNGAKWSDWNNLGDKAQRTTDRNSDSTPRYIGECIFDKTLGKPVWWNGTNWVDAMGIPVD